MASNLISASKGGRKSVPQPENARFALGTRPAVLRAPALDRIKPAKASTRNYGKEDEAPPLAGNTGMTGLS